MEWTAGRGTEALGIIGTSLGGIAVAGMSLLANKQGHSNNNNATMDTLAAVAALSAANNSGTEHTVSRYEASQAARIAELETEVKLRDANTYTDSKILETYQYVDGRLRGIESQICQQNVWNATQTATMNCMAEQIAALNGMTKLVIPKTNVCPEPMDRYNSWAAPTTATAT